MSQDGDIKADINLDVTNGNDNPSVRTALKLIDKSQRIIDQKKGSWRNIQDLFEMGFVVTDPTGTRKIESQLLHQAIMKVVSKMKPLDFSIHGNGVSEDMEKIVTDGVATVLDEGGWDNVLRDKFGTFYRMCLYGDAFVRVGTNPDGDYPITFQNSSLLDVYVDPYATELRTESSANDADELCVIYKYSWDDAIQLYPELEEKGGLGYIPRAVDPLEDMDRDTQQEIEIRQEREVEVAHYYNLSQKRYTVFAGQALTVLEDLEGDEYPFMSKGKPYIPFVHMMCFPSSEGFYNYGIGHILYKLAIITRQLSNRAINYGMDNVDPIRIYNTPQGESAKFFNKMLSAQEAQAAGRKGFIVNEYSASDPSAGQNRVETIASDPLTGEWERLYNRLDKEITRLGLYVDAADRGASRTATQILAEEENQDMFVKQILEQNAGQFKWIGELTMEMVQEFIGKKNKTPINLTTTLFVEGTEMRVKDITLGMLSEELKQNHYFIKVNSRSGAIPSRLMEQAQVQRALATTAPGTMAFAKLQAKLMRLNDQDIAFADLSAPAQAPQGEAPEEGAMPTETDAIAAALPGQQELAAIT